MACFPANLVTFVRAFAKQFFFFFLFSKATYQRIFFRVLREQLETTKSICLRFLAVISLLFVLYEPLKMLNCKNVQSKKKKTAKMFKNEPLLLLLTLLYYSMVLWLTQWKCPITALFQHLPKNSNYIFQGSSVSQHYVTMQYDFAGSFGLAIHITAAPLATDT